MKVGMIGLGAMGEHMARNVAKAGLLTAVWNRSAGKAQKLADELNIICAQSPATLATQVELILLCVSADADVLEMIEAIAETIKPETAVVDMSTVSNTTAQTAARILQQRQAQFLDAPVSGGVEGAKKGSLAMMVGGNANVLERVQPVLQTLASHIVHMGDTGAGQSTKAVNQIMVAGINQAVTEALAFGQAQGLPMDSVIEVIAGGAASNWFLQHRGPTMVQGTFQPGFKLALHNKDLEICKTMANDNDSPTQIIDMTLTEYQTLIAQGYGNEDISALYRLKQAD